MEVQKIILSKYWDYNFWDTAWIVFEIKLFDSQNNFIAKSKFNEKHYDSLIIPFLSLNPIFRKRIKSFLNHFKVKMENDKYILELKNNKLSAHSKYVIDKFINELITSEVKLKTFFYILDKKKSGIFFLFSYNYG